LSLSGHVYYLDATQQDAGTSKSLEAHDGARSPLDGTVILLNEFVQIFPLRDLDGAAAIDGRERRLVGSTIIDQRDLWRVIRDDPSKSGWQHQGSIVQSK